jgi:hypothetical protein
MCFYLCSCILQNELYLKGGSNDEMLEYITGTLHMIPIPEEREEAMNVLHLDMIIWEFCKTEGDEKYFMRKALVFFM